mmetsp:Transcript_68691/g.198956  ORF Transcript_68691/g.198956 Transcript_68691/m.198956 type:complete len:250 (+) Transcript_68691:1020-1769(+)
MYMAQIKGTGTKLKKQIMIHTICAKGKGKGTVVSFLALMKCTMPIENSWNTRERIGAATSTTPVRSPSTTNRWIHWRTTFCFTSTVSRYMRLCLSKPSKSKTLKCPWVRFEMSLMERHSSKLIIRLSKCWNLDTSASNSGFGLQKATKLLQPLSQTPHACSTSVMPSQYRLYASCARKTIKKPKIDVKSDHAVVSATVGGFMVCQKLLKPAKWKPRRYTTETRAHGMAHRSACGATEPCKLKKPRAPPT